VIQANCESHQNHLPMTGVRSFLVRPFFLVLLAAAGIHAPLRAQNLCSAQPTKYPCLDQPYEDDVKITGQLSSPGDKTALTADKVHLTISSFAPKAEPKISADTTFTFTDFGTLGASGTVRVDITGGGSTGDVPIKSKKPTGICAKTGPATDAPCVTQPLEGDTFLKGSMTSKGTDIAILLDGKEPKGSSLTKKGASFTVTGLPKLCTCNKLELIQSSAAKDGSTTPSLPVLVPIKANTKPFNLGLSIPAASESLDFGHQAMQTESAGKQVTITNTTDNAVDLVDPSTTITSTNFRISANSCPTTLQPKAACSFNVVFAPFFPPRTAGQADTDFVVIVPKYDQSAIDEFTSLTKWWQTARSAVKTAKQQIQVLESATSAATFNSVLDTLRGLLRVPDDQKQFIEGVKVFATAANLTDGQPPWVWNFQSAQPDKKIADNVRSYNVVVAKSVADAAQESENQAIQNLESKFQVIALSGSPDHWKYPLTRAVVGVSLAAPSSQAIKQAYFVDFDLLAPLLLPGRDKYKNEDPLENKLWLWFNPRISSLPQAANFSALSTINETGSFFSQESSKGTLGDIQGLDLSGGFEFALVKPRDGIPWWAEYTNTQARLAPSLIVGGGMSTPFSTNNTDVYSQVNQAICDAFSLINPNLPPPVTPPTVSTSRGLICGNTGPTGTPANQTYIVAPNPGGATATKNDPFVDFFTPERSRFFRKAYGGFRLKTYFFSKSVKADCNPPSKRDKDKGDCDGLYDIFPGVIDLTVGKDEAVTAGHMSTWLFRLDAVYPLPFYQGIHIFASAYTALKSNNLTQPYNAYSILTPVTGTNNDFNTFRFGIQPLNRDFFQVGIGIDLIQVFKKASNGGQPNSAAPAPKPSSTTPAS